MKKNDYVEAMKGVASRIFRKYAFSVRKSEMEDLMQTIWFLFLVAKGKYDSRIGNFRGFAYYFADKKLKDHFWRRVNLPQSQGTFTLLHMKSRFIDGDEFESPGNEIEHPFPDVLKMRAEGYSFKEISNVLGVSYSTARRRWKKAAMEFTSRS